jgi:hypothetical protein
MRNMDFNLLLLLLLLFITCSYRCVYNNGGMVINRESVIMCCMVRAIDEYRAMVEW